MEFSWELLAVLMVVGVDKIIGSMRDRGIDLRKVCDQTDELHRWHNREDGDGVKVWYVRKTLEIAIEKLADSIAAQTELLRELHKSQDIAHTRIDLMEARIYSNNKVTDSKDP